MSFWDRLICGLFFVSVGPLLPWMRAISLPWELSDGRWQVYRGSLTVNSRRLDSFLPSPVQMAPWTSQSSVSGSTMVTSPLPFGSTVISHRVLLGLFSRWALRTSPPDTVNAKSLRVL